MAEETKENEKQLLLDLQQSNEVIDLFGSMQLVNKNTVVDKLVETELTKKGKLRANEMCFYRVKQLSFDEDYPHREAFENVLLSMDNDAFNFDSDAFSVATTSFFLDFFDFLSPFAAVIALPKIKMKMYLYLVRNYLQVIMEKLFLMYLKEISAVVS